MKKECTEEQARLKAEAYCVGAERCTNDVLRKLKQWGLPEKLHESVIDHLKKERYIDDTRFAIAFVRDKYRFNQWGIIRLVMELEYRNIDKPSIKLALKEIDKEEYLSILTELLRKKNLSIETDNEYERKGKLLRFAASHGYEMDAILQSMERMKDEDEMVD